MSVIINVSPAYSFIKERVELEFRKLEDGKVTPWAFFSSGKELRLTNFIGKEIRYSGISFDGSPRRVFWRGFIQPFLHDVVSRSLSKTRTFCLMNGIDPERPLKETASLLMAGIKGIYRRMSDIDQRIRGKGYPYTVPRYDGVTETALSEEFVRERLSAELLLALHTVRRKRWLKKEKSAKQVFQRVPLKSAIRGEP